MHREPRSVRRRIDLDEVAIGRKHGPACRPPRCPAGRRRARDLGPGQQRRRRRPVGRTTSPSRTRPRTRPLERTFRRRRRSDRGKGVREGPARVCTDLQRDSAGELSASDDSMTDGGYGGRRPATLDNRSVAERHAISKSVFTLAAVPLAIATSPSRPGPTCEAIVSGRRGGGTPRPSRSNPSRPTTSGPRHRPAACSPSPSWIGRQPDHPRRVRRTSDAHRGGRRGAVRADGSDPSSRNIRPNSSRSRRSSA